MAQQQPLDPHQQELVSIVKAAHQNLALARKFKSQELARRLAAHKLGVDQAAERKRADLKAKYEADLAATGHAQLSALETGSERIRLDLDGEVVTHESALDEALMGAYSGGVPIMRIAVDGFGNRYPGAVQQLINKLRAEGLVGSSVGYQRNSTPAEETDARVEFPKPINVESLLNEASTISEPVFSALDGPLILWESRTDSSENIETTGVLLTMDDRDPYFKSIAKSMRVGLNPQIAAARTAHLYVDGAGKLSAQESNEVADTYWDHPVARWVKDHPAEALAGFNRALSASE